MRLRAIYLLAAAASVAAVLMVAGPAYATSNWSCGETFSSSPAPLDNNLDCSGHNGSALVIAADGVTLNFNGFTVTGYSTCSSKDVVDNEDGYSGLTVENGTIVVACSGYGVDTDGTGNTVANMTIDGGSGTGAYGVDAYDGADGLTVEGSTITGNSDNAVYANGQNMTIEDNTVSTFGSGQGLEAVHGLGDVISNNSITGTFDGSTYQDGAIGIHTHDDTAALISNNTVSGFAEAGYYGSGDSGTMLTDNVFDSSYQDAHLNDHGPESNVTFSGNFFRNAYDQGMHDNESDLNTYVGNVATNDGTECAPGDLEGYCAAFDILPADYGSVTMTNNYARLSSYGFYVEDAYNEDSYATTRSMFSGNSANYNDTGFYDDYSVLATWSGNGAYMNNVDGFVFDTPNHETITGNSATHNGNTGFAFVEDAAPDNPLAVTNNVSEYNGEYGFASEEPLSASSGNTGSNTNGTDDCYWVSGCS